ncbi:MAG TPA: DUF2383 domain-containing protein [Polyangia bacterium]|nr:DUF2383 domain-containing protein [Polyangia bacterium]
MALSTDKIIDECNDLIRFDYDAVGAYNEAIDAITETHIRQQLIAFRGDHERHITDLSALVRRFGGDPPEMPGLRGVVRKTMTKVAGLVGTEATLRAMRSNEEVLNKQYANRSNLDFPTDVLQVIQRNYGDEQRHLAWVVQALNSRLWEQTPAYP